MFLQWHFTVQITGLVSLCENRPPSSILKPVSPLCVCWCVRQCVIDWTLMAINAQRLVPFARFNHCQKSAFQSKSLVLKQNLSLHASKAGSDFLKPGKQDPPRTSSHTLLCFFWTGALFQNTTDLTFSVVCHCEDWWKFPWVVFFSPLTEEQISLPEFTGQTKDWIVSFQLFSNLSSAGPGPLWHQQFSLGHDSVFRVDAQVAEITGTDPGPRSWIGQKNESCAAILLVLC